MVPVAEKIICSIISSLFNSTSLTCTNNRKIGLGHSCRRHCSIYSSEMTLLSISTCVQFSLLVKMCNVQRALFTNRIFLPPANEVCEGYVFTGVCLSTGEVSVHRGSVSRGVSVQGVSVQGVLCPGGSLSRGVSVQGGSLSRETPVQ